MTTPDSGTLQPLSTAHTAEDRTVGINSLVFVIVRDCVLFEAGTEVSGVIRMKGAVQMMMNSIS
jgi:hypothetical protein